MYLDYESELVFFWFYEDFHYPLLATSIIEWVAFEWKLYSCSYFCKGRAGRQTMEITTAPSRRVLIGFGEMEWYAQMQKTCTDWTKDWIHMGAVRENKNVTALEYRMEGTLNFGDSLMCKSKFNSLPDLCKSKFNSLPDLCKSKFNSLPDLCKSKFNSLPDLCKSKFNSLPDLCKTKLNSLPDLCKSNELPDLCKYNTPATLPSFHVFWCLFQSPLTFHFQGSFQSYLVWVQSNNGCYCHFLVRCSFIVVIYENVFEIFFKDTGKPNAFVTVLRNVNFYCQKEISIFSPFRVYSKELNILKCLVHRSTELIPKRPMLIYFICDTFYSNPL